MTRSRCIGAPPPPFSGRFARPNARCTRSTRHVGRTCTDALPGTLKQRGSRRSVSGGSVRAGAVTWRRGAPPPAGATSCSFPMRAAGSAGAAAKAAEGRSSIVDVAQYTTAADSRAASACSANAFDTSGRSAMMIYVLHTYAMATSPVQRCRTMQTAASQSAKRSPYHNPGNR